MIFLTKFTNTKILLSLFSLLIIIGGCSSNEENIWFSDLQGKYVLEPADLDSIGIFIRNILQTKETQLNLIPVRLRDESKPRIIFISVSDGNSSAKVFMGKGYGLIEAINNSITNMNDEFDRNYKVSWIKVDIVSDVIDKETRNLRQPLLWDRTLFGFAFNKESGIAFLPEEITVNTIIDSKQKFRMNNLLNHFGDNNDSREKVIKLFEKDDIQIFRFLTYSFFLENDKVVPLYRGHRMYEKLNDDEVLDAASNGGRYLVDAVNPDGKFVYIYRPKSSKEINSYNIVRHAGTIFSMLQLYEVTGQTALLEKSELALKYLRSTIKKMPTKNGEFPCVVEDGNTKLGGNALAVIALLSYYNQTKEKEYLDLSKQLCKYILYAQDRSGEFTIQKQFYPGGRISNMRSEYYPGEALLALLTLYEYDKDKKWLDAANDGAKFLISIRDGKKKDEELPHDHWLLYALNKLYRYRPNKLYFDHAMRLSNVILNSQRAKTEFRDWVGSFYTPPRSTPTATRMEGLWSAYQLARDYNDNEMKQRIENGLEMGIKFQLQTQFTPETVMYLDDPERSLGGFKRSLTNYEIRIDYTQHNISSLLGMYTRLTEKKN